MYLLLLALLLFSWTLEYSSTALPVALSSKISLQQSPAAFASYVAPEQFRGGGCAQGTSCSPQQSDTAECFGGGEPPGVAEVNGTRLDPWFMDPKTGHQELLPSLDCDPSSGTLWDAAVSTTVRNTVQVPCTIKKSGHPCFNCFTTFGSSVEALCAAGCGEGIQVFALQSSLSASGQKMPVLRQTLSLTPNRLVWGVKPTACIYCPAAARL